MTQLLALEASSWQYLGVLGMGWSLAALVVLTVIRALVRGDLVPRKTLKDWQAAADTKDEQIADQAKQLAALTEVGPTVHQTMQALQDLASQTRQEGDEG